MPNRIIREGILRSRRVNALSDQAELFYRRLMSVVDDYGRFDADPSLLRSSLYPLRINKVSDEDILRWLDECTVGDEPLVELYTGKGVQYLYITGFKQRLRAMKAHYPVPPDKQSSDGRPSDDGHEADAGRLETKRSRNGSGNESEYEKPASVPIPFPVKPSELGIEGWEELVEAGIKAGMSLDPDPSSDLCQKTWRYRDFENRRNCIQGIIERAACGQYSRDEPQFTPTLANYVEKNRWKESIRPRNRGQPADKTSKTREEFTKRLMREHGKQQAEIHN